MQSLNKGFGPYFELISIALYKKYGNDIDSITQKLDEQKFNFNKTKEYILQKF